MSAAYFSLQFLGLRHHLIHTPVDDVIPFVPAFIIPYVLWYFYVPGMMLFMCFKDREVFMRQVATLFTGAFICITVFALYPTRIDFRPDASGDGLLLALCRLIYANDQPGGGLRGGAVSAQHDHRIAMAAAVAACACAEPVTIEGWECTNKSYPRFREDFNALKREETP